MSVQMLNGWNGVAFPGRESFHPRLPIKVVVVYEDFESGLRLIDFTKRLKFRFDEEFTITTNLWKFEMLEIPEVRRLAAKEAATADLILLATNNHHRLPVEVGSWCDQWVSERCGLPGALVVMFSGEAGIIPSDATAEETLRDAAARARLQFLLIDSTESENKIEESFPTLIGNSRRATCV